MVKFLVVRFSSIGDIILTTPVMRHLKNQVEEVEIHFLTKPEYATLLESNPYVDKIHLFEGALNKCVQKLKNVIKCLGVYASLVQLNAQQLTNEYAK